MPPRKKQKMLFPIGTIIWAQYTKTRLWPGLIINGADCGLQQPKIGLYWVYWFGDHRVSKVRDRSITNFNDNFLIKYRNGVQQKGKKWIHGVEEAIKEYASSEFKIHCDGWNLEKALEWAEEALKEVDIVCVSKMSENVSCKLQKIMKMVEEGSSSDEDSSEFQKKTARKVRQRKLCLDSLCICCYSNDSTEDHPIFKGGVCNHCMQKLKSTLFIFGRDGLAFYCTICARRGEMLVCDNQECGRVFCKQCIKTLGSNNLLTRITKMVPWHCFLCFNNPMIRATQLKVKENWKENLANLHQLPSKLNIAQTHTKKALRVLSLFDGIGTGLYVLDSLNIAIEKYYSSEIDEDAMKVLGMNYGDRITHLGDICSITDEQIEDLGPIDLLLAASPCNDLSLANPLRKGLADATGTGILFFDFFRALKIVQKVNGDRPLFWLFENVAGMPLEQRKIINRFLECEPVMLDAAWLSPQRRARLFWGNIPGMKSNKKYLQNCNTNDINDFLTLDHNRVANVEAIRTVTSNLNSLRQGKEMELPVMMDGKKDLLWATELEKIFGFPRHYTDVDGFTFGKRQKLLGKAWSVPVITHILTPLKMYYKLDK